MTWVSRDVRLSAAALPVPEARGSAIAISGLRHVVEAGAFRWHAEPAHEPYRMVLLREDYRTLAEVDGIVGYWWQPEPELRTRLHPGESYHAYLVAQASGRLIKSPLTTFVWR